MTLARVDRAYRLWTAHRFIARAERSYRAGFLRVADYYARRTRSLVRFLHGKRAVSLWQRAGFVLVRDVSTPTTTR